MSLHDFRGAIRKRASARVPLVLVGVAAGLVGARGLVRAVRDSPSAA